MGDDEPAKITPDELLHDVEDEELQRIWAQQDIDQQPVIRDLRAVGYSELDFEVATPPSDAAVEVLARHLEHSHPEWLRAWIARVLGGSKTPQAWRALSSALEQKVQRGLPPERRDELLSALTSSLADIAKKEHLPQVLAWLHDSRLGIPRIFFYGTLTRLRVPDRWEIIERGLSDPDLKNEAAHMLHQRDLRERRKQS